MATIEHSHRSGNNVVGDGYVPDGLLQKAVEQQPGLGRASAVEPELELVQVALKVGHRRGTLRGGLQPALRLRLNAGHGREQDVRRVRCSLGGNERVVEVPGRLHSSLDAAVVIGVERPRLVEQRPRCHR